MLNIKTGRSITGNADTRNDKLTMGNDAVAMSQEERRKTVRSSVKVRKVITNTRWRDKLRNQPRLKDHQAYRNSQGSVAT